MSLKGRDEGTPHNPCEDMRHRAEANCTLLVKSRRKKLSEPDSIGFDRAHLH